MHHSDQDSRYAIEDFKQLLEAQGITCSIIRRGECGDNAAMESFVSSMTTERPSRKVYRTREEAKSNVFDYIERFYCRELPATTISKEPEISTSERY